MKGGVIGNRSGARRRRSGALVDGRRLPVRVVHVARDVAVPICLARRIPIGVVGELSYRGGNGGRRQPLGLRHLRSSLQGRKFVNFLYPKWIGNGAAAISIVVGDPDEIGATGVL